MEIDYDLEGNLRVTFKTTYGVLEDPANWQHVNLEDFPQFEAEGVNKGAARELLNQLIKDALTEFMEA